MSRFIGVLLTLCIPLLFIAPAQAQTARALSAAEKQRAIEIFRRSQGEAADQPSSSAAARGARASRRQDRRVVTSVVPVGPTKARTTDSASGRQARRSRAAASDDPGQPQQAQITEFDYSTGETTRAVVDLSTGRRISERKSRNYPTSLADIEKDEIRELLVENVPEVARVVRQTRLDQLRFQYLPLVFNSRAHPKYGNRVVSVRLTKPSASRRYLVDLTESSVTPTN